MSHYDRRCPPALRDRLEAAHKIGGIGCNWSYEPRGTTEGFVCRLEKGHDGDHVCDSTAEGLSTGGIRPPLIAVPQGTATDDPSWHEAACRRRDAAVEP